MENFEVTEAYVKWMRNLLNVLNVGGEWVIPDTGQKFIKKSETKMVWVNKEALKKKTAAEISYQKTMFQMTKAVCKEIGVELKISRRRK